MSINITKLMSDDPQFSQQLRCRRSCTSQRNFLYVWSSIWGNGNEYSWNPNSNTLDCDRLQPDRPASGVIAKHSSFVIFISLRFRSRKEKCGERLTNAIISVFRDVRNTANISSAMSLRPFACLPVRPSFPTEQLGSQWTGFSVKFDIWVILENLSRKLKFY